MKLSAKSFDPSQIVEWFQNNKGVQDFGKRLGFGTTEEEKAAEQNLDAIRSLYEGLDIPELVAERPEFASNYDVGPSGLNDVSLNPEYAEAQMEQLAALRNLAARGGKSASSDAALARIQANELAAEKGSRDAILQNAAARGMGGSGQALLAQLVSAQNSRNAANLQDLEVHGQNQDRELQALQAAGNMAGSMSDKDYKQQADRAAANDAIARFNAQNRMNVNQYNTNTANQAAQYATGLQQQDFQNRLNKVSGIAGGYKGQAENQLAQNQIKAQQAGNILGGLMKGTGAVAGAVAGAPAAHGGRIPGHAPVRGDSYENDTIPVVLSADEVVVPRSLARNGSDVEIASFVKNPPTVKLPKAEQERQMMLAALQKFRRGVR